MTVCITLQNTGRQLHGSTFSRTKALILNWFKTGALVPGACLKAVPLTYPSKIIVNVDIHF